MTHDETEHRDCLACPEGEKSPAEYHWHNGTVGVFPECEECLRTQLPSRLSGYKKTKYETRGPESFASGFATPIGESTKIVKESDLDRYLESENKEN